MDRREFLKATGGLLLTGASSTLAVRLLTTTGGRAAGGEDLSSGRRYGMVIDLTRCRNGCTACVDACREENNVAYHGDSRWDIHWIRKVGLKNKNDPRAPVKPMLLLCNHCDKPPCAQVCPVQATYKREDGIVIVDKNRCIGCRYCLIACPYNMRMFNFKGNHEWTNKKFPGRAHGVSESCHFCYHRLNEGKQPACVECCPAKARHFGDIEDPTSEVSVLVRRERGFQLNPELGTDPSCYYLPPR